MTNKWCTLGLLILMIGLAGCATYSFIQTGLSGPFPPKDKSCAIDVLTSVPDRPVIEVGICHGQAPGGGIISDNTPDAIEQVKRCACQNGGDAIVLLNTGSTASVMTGFGASQQQIRIPATVLRYK